MNKNTIFTLRKAAGILAWAAGAAVISAIIALTGITLYLTPERLSSLAERMASRHLKADVEVKGLDYTLWSSFPILKIHADSVRIISRTLDSIPDSVAERLPSDASFLASCGRISAQTDIYKALKDEIRLEGLTMRHPRINIVRYDNHTDNFSILPETADLSDMPHLTLGAVSIQDPLNFSFFDSQSKSHGNILAKEAHICATGIFDKHRPSGKCLVRLAASITGRFGEFEITSPTPVSMKGEMTVAGSPLSAGLSGFSIQIPGLTVRTDMEMTLPEESEETPRLKKLELAVSSPDITGIIPYIPTSVIKGNAALTKIIAHMPHHTTIALEALLDFNATHPSDARLDIRNLHLSADSVTLDMDASITGLLDPSPMADANIICDTDLGTISGIIPATARTMLKGRIKGDTRICCSLPGIRETVSGHITGFPKKIKVSGQYRLPHITAACEESGLNADIRGASINVNINTPGISMPELSKGHYAADIYISHGQGSLRDSATASFDNIAISMRIDTCRHADNPTAGGAVSIIADSLSSHTDKFDFSAQDLAFSAQVSMRHSPWTASWQPAATSPDDSIIAARVRHTPLFPTPQIPGILPDILSLADMRAELKSESGSFVIPGYDACNSFSSLHLLTDLDTVEIKRIDMVSDSTAMTLSGEIKGVRGFLSSSSPTLLDIDLDARFNTIDINRIAYICGADATSANKAIAIRDSERTSDNSAADSLCVAIPRNICADIRLHSDSAQYMGWAFSPLSTRITIGNGNATIGDLNIGTPYCSSLIDWTYSTADLSDIHMDVSARIDSFDFQKFLREFPSVSEASPTLPLLSAILSLKADGTFNMFPNMFLDVPSLKGKFRIKSGGIELRREGRLAEITHLMLIKGDSPVKTEPFEISGSLHDNLLQLDPFTLKCGNYEIYGAGVNNMHGEIYYHIGLPHNPFHIPFGVNLVGSPHHPSIRFGGAGVNDSREREIASDLSTSADVNIMRQLREGWRLFIENAAKYYRENNQRR